jgi:hypothetical protein
MPGDSTHTGVVAPQYTGHRSGQHVPHVDSAIACTPTVIFRPKISLVALRNYDTKLIVIHNCSINFSFLSSDPVLRIRDVLSRIPDPDPTIAPSRIRIPDPGGKKAPDPGSDLFFLHRLLTNFVYLARIPDPDPRSGG